MPKKKAKKAAAKKAAPKKAAPKKAAKKTAKKAAAKAKPRTIYEVKPQGDGPGVNTKWALKRRGNQRATDVFDDKAKAVARGRELAKARQPSQLIVHRADGKYEAEFTYGNDPFPPTG